VLELALERVPKPLPPADGVIAERDAKKDENAVSTH
jgi:hypothetical protein